MGDDPETLRASQGSDRCIGVVSGFVLKLIRESVGLTQVQLAEQHNVDVATVQGWESARRPLTSLRTRDLVRLRARLLRCGAPSAALSVLSNAVEADLIISDAVTAGAQLIDPHGHLLGVTAHQRKLTNLITRPFTGIVPAELRHLTAARVRRGPVPEQPAVSADAGRQFFDHLLVTADANHTKADLLRRQAIYLLGFDRRPGTAEWMRTEHLRALGTANLTEHVPSWVAARSSAVALAYSGDRDPLSRFVRRALNTDEQERANLNYWAYWVGEIDTIHVDDDFMVRTDLRTWTGARLLRHLLARLQLDSAHTELNIHTLWALLLTHPDLITGQPALRSQVSETVDHLTDQTGASQPTRRELSDIAYAARMAQQ